MDKRIIWFTISLLLISGAILTYIFYSEDNIDVPVDKVNFSVEPRQVFVGESFTYGDRTDGAYSWLWDFGDEGGVRSLSEQGTYQYFEPGRYTIKLTINEIITDSITIIVNPKDGPAIAPQVIISGPAHAYVGEKVTFTDNTPGAEHTIWKNLDNYETVKDSKTYSYVFTRKGDYEITATNEKNKGSDGQGKIKVHVDVRPARAPDYGGENVAGAITGILSKTDPPPAAQPPSFKKNTRKLKEKELLSYCNNIAADGSFKTTYPFIKEVTQNDESIPVVIINNKGSRVNKKLYGFCQYLNIMRPTVVAIATEWDDATNTIKKITATINER